MESILYWLTISDHFWHVIDTPSATLLENKWFFFYFLSRSVASWWGVQLCVSFPFSVLGCCLVWTCAGFGHAVTVSVGCYVSCFWKILCPKSSMPSESYNICPSFSIEISKPWREQFDKDNPFRAECSVSLTLHTA